MELKIWKNKIFPELDFFNPYLVKLVNTYGYYMYDKNVFPYGMETLSPDTRINLVNPYLLDDYPMAVKNVYQIFLSDIHCIVHTTFPLLYQSGFSSKDGLKKIETMYNIELHLVLRVYFGLKDPDYLPEPFRHRYDIIINKIEKEKFEMSDAFHDSCEKIEKVSDPTPFNTLMAFNDEVGRIVSILSKNIFAYIDTVCKNENEPIYDLCKNLGKIEKATISYALVYLLGYLADEYRSKDILAAYNKIFYSDFHGITVDETVTTYMNAYFKTTFNVRNIDIKHELTEYINRFRADDNKTSMDRWCCDHISFANKPKNYAFLDIENANAIVYELSKSVGNVYVGVYNEKLSVSFIDPQVLLLEKDIFSAAYDVFDKDIKKLIGFDEYSMQWKHAYLTMSHLEEIRTDTANLLYLSQEKLKYNIKDIFNIYFGFNRDTNLLPTKLQDILKERGSQQLNFTFTK